MVALEDASPYSFEALCEAFNTLYDREPEYDPYKAMMEPGKVANEIWGSLEDEEKQEIREYLDD